MSFKGCVSYFKSLVASNTGNSVKSFTLVVSSVVGALLGVVVGFVLVYDVVTNGYIKTDLTELGMFLMCIGVYVTGSGVPKIFGEKFQSNIKIAEDEEGDKD